MRYQLTRRAHNAASYSNRTTKLGKPHDDLRCALCRARAADFEVTITDTQTGAWAKVHTIAEYHTWRGIERAPHVVLELPPAWADDLLSAVGPVG